MDKLSNKDLCERTNQVQMEIYIIYLKPNFIEYPAIHTNYS